MSAEVGLTEAEVVLGQIGEHVEPQACRECGKSATACGRSRNFCCGACSQTRFRTHDPDPEPPAPGVGLTEAERGQLSGALVCRGDVYAAVARIKADAIAQERAAWVAKIEALADKWEHHSTLFTAEADRGTREDWEHVAHALRALLPSDAERVSQ